MLILTRKPNEAILIDGGIRIVVLGTDGSGVRIGIEAPMSVGIVREEVIQRQVEKGTRPSVQDSAQPGHSSGEPSPSSPTGAEERG